MSSFAMPTGDRLHPLGFMEGCWLVMRYLRIGVRFTPQAAFSAGIRDRWPPVNLILTSDSLRPQADLLPEGAWFIVNSYAEDNLIELVHRSLA